jgi:prepilin-type N-terminal cleavage/methylation domain-containing protein
MPGASRRAAGRFARTDLKRVPWLVEKNPMKPFRVLRALPRRSAGDAGFTLIELVVALGIISISVLALLSGFIASATSIQSQQTQARATRVALDRNENLRLSAYDSPELDVGAHTGTAQAADGTSYSYRTVVSERDARPGEDVAGDVVKDIATTVTWEGKRPGSVTYTTAVSVNARDIGLPSGYVQAIKGVSVAPDPSVIVDYDGFTREPITVTVTMTGFDITDVVRVSWTDDHGLRSVNATTTDARYWRVTIPAGSSGLYKRLNAGESVNVTFTATTASNLNKTSTLKVYGPVDNPPVISSFTVAPLPLDMINGGTNRYQNKNQETFTCVIDGLSTSTNSLDSVKATYIGETGATIEVPLTRTAVNGSRTTWTKVFPRSTEYFGIGANLPYTCVARRYTDGGPASKLISVTVKK